LHIGIFFPYYTGIFIFHVLKYIFHDLKYIFQGLKYKLQDLQLKNLFEENRNAVRGCKKGIECP